MATAADIQQIIVDEIGDTKDKILQSRISTYWDSFADKAAIHPRLQEWYTTKRCIDVVLGTLRNQVSFSTDGSLSLQLQQRISYLSDRKKEAQGEIEKLERIARSNRPPVVGRIVSPPSTPILPVQDDADADVFRGSPYFPNRGTGGF